jgi:hypothetical protein
LCDSLVKERSSTVGDPDDCNARNAIVPQQRAGRRLSLSNRPTRRFCFHVSIAGGHPSGESLRDERDGRHSYDRAIVLRGT